MADKVKDIHIYRYLASWRNVGGTFDSYRTDDSDETLFVEWLRSLEFDYDGGKLTDREIDEICETIHMGKFEFERSAKKFLEGYKEEKLQDDFEYLLNCFKTRGATRHEIDLLKRLIAKYGTR